MEQTVDIESSWNPYRLIFNTGSRKPSVSKMIKESVDTLNHFMNALLARWSEHLQGSISLG